MMNNILEKTRKIFIDIMNNVLGRIIKKRLIDMMNNILETIIKESLI